MKITILVPKEVEIDIKLPKPGEEISILQVLDICDHFGLDQLADKIRSGAPQEPFKSDGCSMFPDQVGGTCHYLACFIHDLFYWAGREGEDVERLHADLILASIVSSLHGSTGIANLMLPGVRVGGATGTGLLCRWGYGR